MSHRLSDRLNPWPETPIVRWLLQTRAGVSPAEYEALIQDVDITFSGVMSSAIAITILGVMFVIICPGWYFGLILAATITVNLFRAALCGALARGTLRGSPVVTDVYVYVTLIWALLLGLMTGGGVWSNISTLQIFGIMTSSAFQGLLCARNYPVPRLALTILVLIDAPVVLSCTIAHNHWLAVNAALTPFWLLGSFSTVIRFQKLAIASYAARFASQEKARRDPLTEALNRLGLAQVCAHPDLPGELTLFCLDLDGFKLVNDTLGHPAGDTLLKLVTARLLNLLRKSDTLARCGGDEFVIVAPHVGAKDAEKLAARLIDAVAGTPYRLDGGAIASVGVSVGFACMPDDAVGMTELNALADEALYESKRGGKGIWRRGRQSIAST